MLRIALESGFGGECASMPEALHALSVGFPKDKVVFDSPCKTKVSCILTHINWYIPFGRSIMF